VTLNDLAKYSTTQSVTRSLRQLIYLLEVCVCCLVFTQNNYQNQN